VSPPRRQQILEALARELEGNPGSRITTARLARAVGVSEAALYRHFPSKEKMFEALIVFAEDSVFGLVNRVVNEEESTVRCCEVLVALLLGFSDRNPGITRVLLGEALVGESEALRARVAQFFNRCETQTRQILRQGVQRREVSGRLSPELAADLLMAIVQGRMTRYSASGFRRGPLEGWDEQWPIIAHMLFG